MSDTARGDAILAFDLGAESGRAVLGRLDDGRVSVEEIRRFPNGPVPLSSGLHWDVLRLWQEVLAGLADAARRAPGQLASVGVSTWGVDFALLGRDGELLGNPHCYRDPRADGMVEEACRRVPRAELYARTGSQILQINSLYQLLAMATRDSPILAAAERLLMLPDLFHYWLTGVQANEFSAATTTQCYDPRAGDWARDVLVRLGIRPDIFGEIVPPGTLLGPLSPQVAEAVGASVPVIAPAGHDTASAIAAVPAQSEDFAYISTGTWCLMGAELPAPLITPMSEAYNFTNEGGIDGRINLLRNICGLWLVQECRRTWAAAGREYSYAELTQLAQASAPFGAVVDPDDPLFLAPGDMPSRLRAACRASGQREPQTDGEVVRCALESLAVKFRWVLARLEELLGRRLGTLHVLGGGANNALLCQLTADACARPVMAGPVEATALGNVLIQARALGRIGSLAELRAVVRASFPLTAYEPRPDARWDERYAQFLAQAEQRGARALSSDTPP